MFDTYMQIDGIAGESLNDAHKDWIEVLSFDHMMHQPTSSTRSSAGGATTGRAQHGDFEITKHVDKSSPKLYEALSTGKHFKKIKLEACRAGGSQVKFMEITMEEVLVSSANLTSANGKTGDALPTERLAFNYGKIEWTYTQQKRTDGSGGGNVTAKYDLTAGKS